MKRNDSYNKKKQQNNIQMCIENSGGKHITILLNNYMFCNEKNVLVNKIYENFL